MAEEFYEIAWQEQISPSLHNNSQSIIDLVNSPVYHDKTKHMIPLHSHTFKRWYVVTEEDTHKSGSCRYIDQGGHGGEAENLFSFRGSSRLRIRS